MRNQYFFTYGATRVSKPLHRRHQQKSTFTLKLSLDRTLVRVMACCLSGAKPLSIPTLTVQMTIKLTRVHKNIPSHFQQFSYLNVSLQVTQQPLCKIITKRSNTNTGCHQRTPIRSKLVNCKAGPVFYPCLCKVWANHTRQYIDGLVHDCSYLSALTMESLQPCAKPSTYLSYSLIG